MTSLFKYFIGLGIKGFGLPGKLANAKIFLNGGQSVTFLRPDGYFSLYPFYMTWSMHKLN